MIVTLLEVLLLGFAVWSVLIAIPILLNSINASPSSQEDALGEPIFDLSMISHGRQLWVQRGISEIVTVDLDTDRINKRFNWNGRPVTNSFVSRDGLTSLLSIEDRELVIFRGPELLVLEQLSVESSLRIALSSNGQTAIGISDGMAVRCWDLSNDEPAVSNYLLPEATERIALDSEGKKLLVSNRAGMLRVYDAKTGRHVQALAGAGPLTGDPVFADDGFGVAVVCGQSVTLYDLRSGTTTWTTWTHEADGFRGVAFSPDGMWIAANGISVGIHVMHRSSGENYRKFSAQCLARKMAFSPSSDKLYSGRIDGSISVWSLPDDRELKKIIMSQQTCTVDN